MKKQPYQKQPGDFEIRILKDSRLVLVGPDQELVDWAQSLCQKPQDQETDRPHLEKKRKDKHGSTPDATQAASQTE